jgi:uncharacterized protein (TIGR02145 family)
LAFTAEVEDVRISYLGDIISYGKITLTAPSGTAPYQYRIDGNTWNNFTGNIAIIDSLTEGLYFIEVRDAQGCTAEMNLVVVKPDPIFDLLDCNAMIDRTANEDYYQAGYYTHAGADWDAVLAFASQLLDSIRYIINDTTIISGTAATLNDVQFPVGVSEVIVVGYLGDISDTCQFTVTVIRACPATTTDIHGNIYDVVALPAGVCWTTNLRATRYANGDPIEFARVYQPGIANHDSIFGLLYTWYSAMNVATPTRGLVQGICPDGWHLPSQAEWALLDAYDAEHLKSADHWLTPGTNATGFNSRPAGRYDSATDRFVDLYGFTGYWASDNTPNQNAHAFILNYYCDTPISSEILKSDGLSVRCILD